MNQLKNEHTIFIWPEGVIPNTNLKKLNMNMIIYLLILLKKTILLFLGINDDNLIDGEKNIIILYLLLIIKLMFYLNIIKIN